MTPRQLYEKVARKGVRASASAAASRIAEPVNERVLGPLLSPWRKGQIALFHVGRSGSSVLASCLNQHSQIYWGGEIFKFYYLDGPYDPLDVLETERLRAGRCYFGFEVKPYHLHDTSHSLAGHIEALRRHGVEHFILLRRKNLLRKIVSSRIASKHRHHISSDENRKRMKAHMDLDGTFGKWEERSLLDNIDKLAGDYETISDSIEGDHVLELTYEDDIYESPLRAYRKIVDFLGEEREEVEVKLKKTNPFPLRELIANFEEVEDRLKGTEHEWMLYA